MDAARTSYRSSSWISVEEFKNVKELIFDSKSIEDKKKALDKLKSWKVRRGQDTALGVLCTIILLDVHVKDSSNDVKDRSILNTLYGAALTKFINYATTFKLGTSTMYSSANQLGIDPFLIDLRHSFAHGRQNFNLDVYRNSHTICMKWIKEYYWDMEIENIQDVSIRDLRYDASLEEKLDEVFTFYDLLAELQFKDFKNFEELENSNEVSSQDRWPLMNQFMMEKDLKSFVQAFKYFTGILSNILASKEMRLNSRTFFHVMLNKCDFFMSASFEMEEIAQEGSSNSDEEEVQITPMKRQKRQTHQSVVQLYQNLIWNIAKHDYLKAFLDALFQIHMNNGESKGRQKASRFWIEIIVKSYNYYQKYCELSKSNVISEKKITQEVKNIYSYQLNANLRNVLIFVGTQMLPTSLKYSHENVLHLFETIGEDVDDLEICLNLISLIYPPLDVDQIESMKKLIDIKIGATVKGGKAKDDSISTVADLLQDTAATIVDDKPKIWKPADRDICWSSFPIGYVFAV